MITNSSMLELLSSITGDLLLQPADECDITTAEKHILFVSGFSFLFFLYAAVGWQPEEMAHVLSTLEEFL